MCDPERWSNGRNGMNHIYFFLPSSFPICPSILSSSDLLNCGRWRSRESTAKSGAIASKTLLRGWRGNGEKHGVVGGWRKGTHGNDVWTNLSFLSSSLSFQRDRFQIELRQHHISWRHVRNRSSSFHGCWPSRIDVLVVIKGFGTNDICVDVLIERSLFPTILACVRSKGALRS